MGDGWVWKKWIMINVVRSSWQKRKRDGGGGACWLYGLSKKNDKEGSRQRGKYKYIGVQYRDKRLRHWKISRWSQAGKVCVIERKGVRGELKRGVKEKEKTGERNGEKIISKQEWMRARERVRRKRKDGKEGEREVRET